MNETPVTVVGNVASELRVRRFGPDDERVVGFRVASSERRWDRETQSWIDGDRFSAWVSCWRRLGDGVVRSLVKGDPVVIAGRLSVREYEADGQRRYSTEIAASAVGPDLSRSTATVARRRLAAVPDTATADDAAAADQIATGVGPAEGADPERAGGPGGPSQAPGTDTPPAVTRAGADEDDDPDEYGGADGADTARPGPVSSAG